MAIAPQPPPDDEKPFRVRKGRVDSVDIFEIKDSELDLLERGSPADLQFNFAIFFVSTALSAIAALATSTFKSEGIKTIFIVVGVVGLLLGFYLAVSWYRNRTSLKSVCAKIRSRIPPDAPSPPAPQLRPSPPSPE